jgi:hypothetical protein
MKEPYVEGLANHNGHESCAGNREVTREALDSGMCRVGIEPRKLTQLECRRGSGQRKAKSVISKMRDINELCVVEDPIHAQKLYARESGEPVISLALASWVRTENPNGVQQ